MEAPGGTVVRRPDSARRTSSIDVEPHSSSMRDGFDLVAVARDLRTLSDGTAELVDSAAMRVVIDGDRRVAAIDPPIDGVVGHLVTKGWRALLRGLLPDDAEARTARFLLLDDLPVAAVISGYADLYLGPRDVGLGDDATQAALARADLCAGWARDATMITAVVDTGVFPVPEGPPAPYGSDDPFAWHALRPLPIGAMRRARRIDVWLQDGEQQFDAMFRDTHVAPSGAETVLHEWWAEGAADASSGAVLRCSSVAGPLPWPECPGAAASAASLVGRTASELREIVAAELRGTSTCTHLNDLLRSLADVPALAVLSRASSGTGAASPHRPGSADR
jgi:hypothetical protein